jgi:putative transposase
MTAPLTIGGFGSLLMPDCVEDGLGGSASGFGYCRRSQAEGAIDRRKRLSTATANRVAEGAPAPAVEQDRCFWIWISQWFAGWRSSLLIVRPETVLRWHRRGWRAYWSWRSSRRRPKSGRPPIPHQLQALIRRMTAENQLWGQRRIQAELARLGFTVSTRTVAKYMGSCHSRGPSSSWREFLKRHDSNIWACDFFCVRTILFETLHVFFVVRHINREILHIAVTSCPTAEWVAQQVVECCAWDRWPPRFLIHDRDSCYGATFNRRLRSLGIKQVRTPFRAPRANAISERWIKVGARRVSRPLAYL